MQKHSQILVIAPSWVGDMVMSQPLLTALKQQNPDAAIDVYAPAWSLGLVARMPEVRAGLINPFAHGAIKLAARFREGRRLAKTQYTQVIVLPNSLKSALVPFFACIPQRTGWLGEARYGLLNDYRKLNKQAHPLMVQRFVALAYPKHSTVAHQPYHPQLESNPQQQAATLQALGLSRDKPILALCPGAEYGPAKRWPPQHFAEVAQAYHQQGYQVWILGSNKDLPIAEKILHTARHAINLCGKTNLAQVIDLLAMANAAVSNDSGLMHIAAAVNTPLVAVYGSSSPDFTPPLAHNIQITQLDLPCIPCFKRECPLTHTDCLQKLVPQTIQTALNKVIHAAQPRGYL